LESTGPWLARHTARAPAALRQRVLQHVQSVTRRDSVAETLAEASREALRQVERDPAAGRPVALDLLAADALITLALLAQAQERPSGLDGFATDLLQHPVGRHD
jgi:hypothetical protein